MARNIILGLLALTAAAPALAAPATTQARASIAGPPADFQQVTSPPGASPSTAQLQLPANNTQTASAFGFADFGKLKAATSVSFNDYVYDINNYNGVYAFASATFADTLTGATIDPVGFAKIKVQVDGSVAGGGGTAGIFGDSRFNLSFFATSSDNEYFSKFLLQTLISADPITGDVLLNHSLVTENLFGGAFQSGASSSPADPFGTYEWVIPFDINQSWSLTGNLTCLTSRFANGNNNENDTANLNCSLGNSVTLMGISFLDPGSNPVSNVSLSSLSGQNYSVPYAPLPAVPEPASWAMLIAGFVLVGAAARRRRMVAA
jgi:hypothetical protein